MNKNYLPSRQFIIRIIIIAVIVAVVWGIYETTSYFMNRPKKEEVPTKLLVKDVVQKDSNNNGIPDWEEILWGLDPSKDGPSNKEFVTAKQESLSKESNASASSSDKATGNELLSQQFFSVIMSLQQTGNLDEASMQSVANAIGQKIVAVPIADVYTKDMLTVKTTTISATDKYYESLKKLLLKYKDKDIGNELTFIAQGVQRNDPQVLYLAGTIASEYKSFADELIKIPVPEAFWIKDLSMANNYDKVSQSIGGLIQIIADPITGMRALINYKKYSDALTADITYFSDNFK
jgi:hypothetical protein